MPRRTQTSKLEAEARRRAEAKRVREEAKGAEKQLRRNTVAVVASIASGDGGARERNYKDVLLLSCARR